jgi:hypothetical protein
MKNSLVFKTRTLNISLYDIQLKTHAERSCPYARQQGITGSFHPQETNASNNWIRDYVDLRTV